MPQQINNLELEVQRHRLKRQFLKMLEEDVKEFIRILKEDLPDNPDERDEFIDKFAGDRLT